MDSNWLNNPDARRRVADILQHAGIPLELLMADECRNFCLDHQGEDKIGLDTRRLVYSPHDDPDSYREVDQVIHIHKEFPLGQHTGIQVFGTIPIECKHRHDIEYFAFPVESESIHDGFPLWSCLAGSQLFRSLRKSYTRLAHFPSVAISAIEIKDGKTPSNLYKENLLYNSVGSLYDFVLTDLRESPLFGNHLDKEDWSKTDAFKKFQQYIESNRYAWWSVLRDWISSLSIDECRSFNQALFKEQRIYYGVSFMMPIVCVNGPIYKISCNPISKSNDFIETDSCLISVRKQKWPGLARFALLRRTPEVPAILTNPKGLRGALETALSWYQDVQNMLSTANPIHIERWPLEAALYSRALTHYEVEEPLLSYRSDLDIEDRL